MSDRKRVVRMGRGRGLVPGSAFLLLLLGGGSVLLSACASTAVPKEHLYLLPLLGRGASPSAGKGPVLLVEPVKAVGLCRGDRIWARVSGMEAEPWVRHRWALPAPQVVRRAAAAWARGKGLFSQVRLDPLGVAGDRLCLRLTLTALEEVDRPEGIFARIRMEAFARRISRGKGEGRPSARVVEVEEPVREKDAAGVVRALGRAFGKAMDELLEAWIREGLLERPEETARGVPPGGA